jgi:integrase
VRSVAEEFIAKYAKPRNRTANEVARMFELHLYPKLGSVRIEAVARRDVLDLLDSVEEKTSGARANRVLANVRRMFSWAVERSIIETSPAANVRAPGQERSRDRVLSDAEVRAFLAACHALGEPFGGLFKLLLLTGQRLDEVASMPWSELDLTGAVWNLPSERTKNKRASTVPLARQSVEILEGLMKRSPLVFPATYHRDRSRTEPQPVSGFAVVKRRLDAMMLDELRRTAPEATLPGWRLHDLRRTAASGMARNGAPVFVVEALLNHKSGTISGVAAVYNRFDYADEKQAAASAWANYLDGLAGRSADNVVPIGAAR